MVLNITNSKRNQVSPVSNMHISSLSIYIYDVWFISDVHELIHILEPIYDIPTSCSACRICVNLCIIHKFFPDQSAEKEEGKKEEEVMVCDEVAWLLRFLS